MGESDRIKQNVSNAKRIAELEAKVKRLEKAAREFLEHCVLGHGDYCWSKDYELARDRLTAALEGKQGGVEKERCPHLAGDLCIKEGACECYGVEQDG